MITCAEAAGVEIASSSTPTTGYIFNLSLDLYGEVIRRFRAAFPEPTIICGSTAVGASGELFKPEWYRPHFEIAQGFDKVEMMIMTSKLLNELGTEKTPRCLFRDRRNAQRAGIVHALEPAFVPWATPLRPLAAARAGESSEVRRWKDLDPRRAPFPLLGFDVP